MGRSWKWIAGFSFVAFALLAVAWAAQPETVMLDACGTKKSAVAFDHPKHAAAADKCSSCHHTQEDLTADSTEVEKCVSCHFEPEKEETPDCSQMSPSKNPYHKTCLGCHKALAKEDETSAAPTKCDGCHPKE